MNNTSHFPKKLPLEITCDMGEGMDNDALLMPYVHSCSIACGYHAGGDGTMAATVALAKKHNKLIGAHPSFPDREGFGRREMDLPKSKLITIIKDQILLLRDVCKSFGMPLSYVKPHGALYNMAAKEKKTAEAILEALLETDKNLYIFAPFKSIVADVAMEKKIMVKYEVFADRNYLDDLSLQPRKNPDALIEDPLKVVEHVSNLIKHECIKTISGKLIPVKADVLCIHGDNPHALQIAQKLYAVFQ